MTETQQLVAELRAMNVPFGMGSLVKTAADVIETLDRRVTTLEVRATGQAAKS
jgi:hypothetical protein